MQRGLVWLSGLTATALTVFLARLFHHLWVLFPGSMQEEAVKQRMMGSTCSAALKMKPFSQVRLLPTPRICPDLEVPIASSDYRCRSVVGCGGCGCESVCLSAVLPVCPAHGRICMNQSQKLIDEIFFFLLACLLAAAPPIPSSDEEHLEPEDTRTQI